MKKGDSIVKVDAHLGDDKDENPIYTTIYVPVSEIYLVVEFNPEVIIADVKIPKGCTALIYLHTEYSAGLRTLCVRGPTAEQIIQDMVTVSNR